MNNFFDSLKRIFQRSVDPSPATVEEPANGSKAGNENGLTLDEAVVSSLMQMIEHTKEGEYTCEETLDLLDEYVELAVDNQDVASIMPLVKNHISDCPDCTERLEALVQILQAPRDIQLNN
jgi:hypothetical protein